ncbi:hypothetical protein PRIPAC_90528, partial [Pristionchus pacificus]
EYPPLRTGGGAYWFISSSSLSYLAQEGGAVWVWLTPPIRFPQLSGTAAAAAAMTQVMQQQQQQAQQPHDLSEMWEDISEFLNQENFRLGGDGSVVPAPARPLFSPLETPNILARSTGGLMTAGPLSSGLGIFSSCATDFARAPIQLQMPPTSFPPTTQKHSNPTSPIVLTELGGCMDQMVQQQQQQQ